MVDKFDLLGYLNHLARYAATVSGADAVAVVLADPRGGLQLAAATNQAGSALESVELHFSEGPGRDVYQTGLPVGSRDLCHARDVWPRFAPVARAAGFESVHAVPLRLRDQIIGALTMFGRHGVTFATEDLRIVQSLADMATIAILQQRSLAEAEVVNTQLQCALNNRMVIEQAKGALSRIEGVSVDEAFFILRSRARNSSTRLVQVAQAVLDSRLRQSSSAERSELPHECRK